LGNDHREADETIESALKFFWETLGGFIDAPRAPEYADADWVD